MKSQFKPGDRVVLINKAKVEDEGLNWIEEEDVVPMLGDVFTVNSVSWSGWVRLEGLRYSHPGSKFIHEDQDGIDI